jgi:hypothetical protein
LSLGDLVTHDDVLGIDLLTGLRTKLAVFDSMPGFFVDLMKSDLLPLRRCREQLDRTQDQRQTQISLPKWAWGHRIISVRKFIVGRMRPANARTS